MTETIAPFVNFSIVVFVLWFFGRKGFSAMLVEKSDLLARKIKEGKSKSDIAHRELKKWEALFSGLIQEVNTIKLDSQKYLEKFKSSEMALCKLEVDRVTQEGHLSLLTEQSRVRSQLMVEVAQGGVSVVKKYFSAHPLPEIQKKLTQNFIESVKHGN